MGLDIRVPIGLMFTTLGAMLTVYGFVTNGNPMYASSSNLNVNIYWGLAQLVFGLLMLYFGKRGAATMRPSTESPEGAAIEEREHRTGLESERPPLH